VAKAFPGVDPRSIPPFGGLLDVPVFADVRLTGAPTLAFDPGPNEEPLRMEFADFERVVRPRIANLCT
jgi:Ala-tRNA(Pro) deacylase